MRRLLLALGVFAPIALPAAAQTLRIAMNNDPDTLDPTLSRTFVGTLVMTGDVRQARGSRQQAADRAETGYQLRMGGQQDHPVPPAPGRAVPGRREDGCSGGEIHVGPQPEFPRQFPPCRDRGRRSHRGGGSAHRASGAAATLLALGGAADRSVRHDAFAQGGGGGGKGFRIAPGMCRAVQIRRAGGTGPHHARPFPAILGCGERAFRPLGRLPADDRFIDPAGQSAGRGGGAGGHRAHRRGHGEGRSETAPLHLGRARLHRDHHQCWQQPGRRHAAWAGCAGPAGAVVVHRPGCAEPGGL